MLTERFDHAVALAHDLHRHQVRKQTTIPYISHLLIVAGMVIENGGEEDTAIAALLHDSVEDQGGDETLELIKSRFGDRVASIVSEVSESATLPKPPWRERKEAYLGGIRRMSPEALLIALADKLANARATLMDHHRLGDEIWTRFNAGKADQAWFYQRFLEEAAAHAAVPRGLIAELGRIDRTLFG